MAKTKEFNHYESKIDNLLNAHKMSLQKSQSINNSMALLNNSGRND